MKVHNLLVTGSLTSGGENITAISSSVSSTVTSLSSSVSTSIGSLSSSMVSSMTSLSSSLTSSMGSLSSSMASSMTSLSSSLTGSMGSLSSSMVTSMNSLSSSMGSIMATTGSNLFKGDQTISGSIIPSVNNTYDLGSPTQQFRHVYISSGSLYVNGTKVLGSTAQELQITTDAGQSFKILEAGSDTITLQAADGNITLAASGGGDVILDPTSGVIALKGTTTLYAGNKILSSDGNAIQIGNSVTMTGSLIVTGFIETQELRTTYISSSILYRSGSTKFGDELTDTHSFTGSLSVSGSISVPGSGLISGSSQISYSGLSGVPSGIVSGSAQLPSGLVSGSAQTIANLPSGTVSGSSQVLNGTTIHSGSFFNGISVVSGSVQVDVMSTTNIARLATTGSNTFSGNIDITVANTPQILLTHSNTSKTFLMAVDGSNAFFRANSTNNILFQVAGGTTALTIASTGASTFNSSIDVTTSGSFGFQDYRTQDTQKVLVLRGEGVSGTYSPSLFNIYTKPGTTSNGIASIIIKSKYGGDAESGNLFEFKGDGSATFSSSVRAASLSMNVGSSADRILYISANLPTTGASQFQSVMNGTFINAATNLYGMYVGNNTNVNVTNSYALFLESTGGSGTITNKYGIYQSGGSDQNYFAGSVTFSSSVTANGGATITGGNFNINVSNSATYATIQMTNNASKDFQQFVFGSGRGDVYFGQAAANWAVQYTTTANGLMTGTYNNTSYIIGTNNTARLTIANSGGVTLSSSLTVAGITTTAVIKGDSGAAYPHSFTNTHAGNTHWTNRGGRLLTSNGSNWAADGKDPIMALVGSTASTVRGQMIGLALHNDNNTTNAFSPMIAFSALSNSTGYNSSYASIMGKKTGTGSGLDTNWNKGELHFYAHGDSYVADTPNFLLSGTYAQFNTNLTVTGNISNQGPIISVGGVTRHCFSGSITGNQSITFTINNQTQSVFKITCMFNHYGYVTSYGCANIAFIGIGPVITVNNVSDIQTGNGGSWTYAKVSDTQFTVTKNAGTYGGGGNYFVEIVGNNSY